MKIFFLFFFWPNLIFFSIVGLSAEEEPDRLSLLSILDLPVPEPSGLFLDPAGAALWTVSDETGDLYQLNWDGSIRDRIMLDANDLEGVTIVDGFFFVLEELGSVLKLDPSGELIEAYDLSLPAFNDTRMEGITYNPCNHHFYVVNEKNNCLLLEYDDQFNAVDATPMEGMIDLSGMCFDALNNGIWITSHESKALLFWDIEKRQFIERHTFDIEQAEGVAIDPENQRVYIVGDKDEQLFTYSLNSLRWILHTTSSTGGFSTRVIVLNQAGEATNVSLQPYYRNGEKGIVKELSLVGHQMIDASLHDLFGAQEVSHFSVYAPSHLSVSVAYKVAEGPGVSAHINETIQRGREFFFFPGEQDLVFDGIAIVNLEEHPCRVTMNLLNKENESLLTVELENALGARSKLLATLDDYPLEYVERIQITTSRDVGLLLLRGSRPGFSPGFLFQVTPIQLGYKARN